MTTRLLQLVFLIYLLLPMCSIAATQLTWQNTTLVDQSNLQIGAGSWLSKQGKVLLLSNTYLKDRDITQVQHPHISVISNNSQWQTILLPHQGNRPFATAVEHSLGTLVIGGLSNNERSDQVNLLVLNNDKKQLTSFNLPNLPNAVSHASALIYRNTLYVVAQVQTSLGFYSLDLEHLTEQSLASFTRSSMWQIHQAPSASFVAEEKLHLNLVTQHNGQAQQMYAMVASPATEHSTVWQFMPERENNHWSKLSEYKGTVAYVQALGKSHILAFESNAKASSFNAITSSWTDYTNQFFNTNEQSLAAFNTSTLNLSPIKYGNQYLALVSNSSSSHTFLKVSPSPVSEDFGWINMSVLVIYLLGVLLVGLFFVFKNKNTDDYFRGGQNIPWWAAACSIYATMLSSLTYVALPAIVYQTNWLLLLGVWMIVAVAPIAVYVAIPFFRQIDATSAYEYLSKRFNLPVRLFASGLFTLFHIGRMGIVMALTALALSAVTPLSASESVLLMGVLCLIYCTLGGIEAVIWTDTLQTIVLLIGAITCFVTILLGLDGGFSEFVQIGLSDDKFTFVNVDFSLDSMMTLSIWVIILGGIGQNISSYTADQAVVQRYMVTSSQTAAQKSIWANALIAVPGSLLFFCIGTGLYAFYKTHPEKLDPTIQIDQIFPMFIASELPIGIAGLIVAGIFAAAQSTVSTSMNSSATTLVTDFIRPFNLIKTEQGYMRAARWLTFILGTLGTLAGLIFIDPEIRSLMEAYFKVIGMFMGALGGLFVLGALTKKANSFGATLGISAGVITMITAWQYGWANGYLYATIGIITCLVVGYFASFLFPPRNKDLTGLTLYTMRLKHTN